MTIKHSGQLSFADFDAEINHAGHDLGSYRGKDWWFDSGVGGKFSSNDVISFGALYDKRFTNPGSGGGGVVCEDWALIYSDTTYTVPDYATLTVIGIGGGGGGATSYGINAISDGGDTKFGDYCIATGGKLGQYTYGGVPGTGGIAAGGDTNYTGGTGGGDIAKFSTSAGQPGGNAGGYGIIPYAGGGGYNGSTDWIGDQLNGFNYGGGGAGTYAGFKSNPGYGGGGGGAFLKTFIKGQNPQPGTQVAVKIGAAGLGALNNGLRRGGNGGAGILAIKRCYIPCVPSVSNFTPGSYDVTIPDYVSLTVELWGGGGTGGNQRNPNPGGGYDAGDSTFLNLFAGGGKGGGSWTVGNYNGTGGKAVGGDINYDGATGQNAWPYAGAGGNAGGYGIIASSGAGSAGGGYQGNYYTLTNGGNYGGGSGGIVTSNGGGGGAYVKKTYHVGDPGAPVPKSVVKLVVAAGAPGRSSTVTNGKGGDGHAIITVNFSYVNSIQGKPQ